MAPRKPFTCHTLHQSPSVSLPLCLAEWLKIAAATNASRTKLNKNRQVNWIWAVLCINKMAAGWRRATKWRPGTVKLRPKHSKKMQRAEHYLLRLLLRLSLAPDMTPQIACLTRPSEARRTRRQWRLRRWLRLWRTSDLFHLSECIT